MPVSEPCSAACARLEAIGPVNELLLPRGDYGERSVVTFADGRWYAAWGGGQANATLVQRFTADGRTDGPALRIEGTTPYGLVSTRHAGGQLILFGSVPPAYTAAGAMWSVHRLNPDLERAGAPLLLRGPGTLHLGVTVETNDAGELLWTSVLDRPGGLVREVRVAHGEGPKRAIAVRDWSPGVDREGAFERIDGQGYFVDASQGALRIRALLDNGMLGAPRRVFDVPVSEGRQLVLSKRVGSRWYLGAHAARRGATVRMQALDTASLAPVGGLMELSWPGDGPYSLIDANGTPMLLGNLQPDKPSRASLVPLDVAARAACPASTIVVPSLPGQYQTIRALHFNGDVAGVTVAAWGNTVTPRVFFTRLRCVGSTPVAPLG